MERFEKYLEGKSEKTIYEYSLDVRKFLDWKKNKTIDKELLNEYIEDLMEHLSIVTVNRKINSLNQYLKYLNIPIHLKNKKIQGHTFLDDMLSNEDVFHMYHEADERTKLIIETLYLTGLRVSEMLQIKVRHINRSEIIIRGKGDKFRTIFIPDGLKESWQKYAEKNNIKDGYLFTGQRGRITRSTVFTSLKKTAKKANVDEEKVYCHAFRHLFAKNLDAAGVSYSAGKQLMGHSLGTQDLYRSFSKKELLEVLNNLYFELKKYI
jgi:integrase/recombinase XerD